MNIFKKVFVSTTIAGIVGAISFSSAFAASSAVSIKAGDTFWTLSQAYHVTAQQIMAANPSINSNNLTVGSRLVIPASSSTADRYTVKSGDTFWLISQRFGISESALLAANSSINPDNLLPGTSIIISSNSNSTANLNTSQTSSSYNSNNSTYAQNLYWLAQVINAEAGGEPLNAQIGVGNVVMHRMQSPGYPHTVQGVVFQKINGVYQFSCVPNGYIYTTPSSSSVQAAIDVLQKNIDVVPGAYVFYNPSQTSAGNWVRNQPTITKIGNFIFAK